MVPTVKRLQIDQSRNLMNRNESRSNAGLEFTAVHTWAVYPSSTLSLQNNSSKAAVQVLMEIMWNWAWFCIITICLVQFNNISVFGIYLKLKYKNIAGLKILNVKKRSNGKRGYSHGILLVLLRCKARASCLFVLCKKTFSRKKSAVAQMLVGIFFVLKLN